MSTADDAERARERILRARNRALVAVLVVWVALFYLITLVRIRG